MQYRLYIISLLLSLMPLVALSDVTDDYEEDVYFLLSGEADKAIADGDYPTAVDRIKEAMSVDPSNPSNVLLMCNLATVYSYMGCDSLSLLTYDQAHAMAPSMTFVLERRALERLRTGNTVGAFDDLNTVVQRDSLNLTARYYRGMMLLYGGDRYGAEADFDVLRDEAPNTFDTSVALATLFSLTGRDREAIPYYKKIIEADPAPEFYAALAGCYLAVGELSEANATITEALKQYPDDPELYYYRAWYHRDSYRLKEAQSDAAKAVALGLDPKKVQQLLGAP